MNRKRMLCFLLGGLLLGPGIGVSRAGPITWDFTGEVTFVSDRNGVFGESIVVGSEYVGSITFESKTPDSMPDDPHGGRFIGALIDISGILGSVAFSGPAGSEQFISVSDDRAGTGDGFNVFSGIELFGQPATFRWIFVDSTQTVFSTDQLPIAPIDVNSFDGIRTDIFSESGTFRGAIGVEIRSITPEPGSLVLLLVGVALIGRRRVSRCC